MEDIKYFIWFTMIFGVGSETAWKFIKSHNTVYDAYSELTSGSCELKLTASQSCKLNGTSLENAEKIITYCNENNIKIICYNSENYPEHFRNIKCPPTVLYYKGDISCISHEKNITCIGTRNPCEYTADAISKICTELALNGFTIISGFAVGSDIMANISAIKCKCPTACVLGSAIDISYPKENIRYREDVIENGGVLISEAIPQTPTFRCSFPKRNRLLAALSPITIVFEAGEKSGSLNTAGIAHEQNKTIFCLPPSDIFDSRYSGNVSLLRTFAKPIYSIKDIFDAYNAEYKVFSVKDEVSDISESHTNTGKNSAKSAAKAKTQKKSAKSAAEPKTQKKSDAVSVLPSGLPLTPVQEQLLQLLENGELHMDAIIEKMNMDISDIITDIMELQLSGLVIEKPGSRFAKR